MLNESKGIDVGTATEDCSDLDDSSEVERYDMLVQEQSMRPSGSRTLDNRLNPDAPDFVPGVTARLLATKIIDELTSYPQWSNASGDIVSYGPRYDSIWRESSPKNRAEAQTNSNIDTVMLQPPSPPSRQSPLLPTVIEIVGDMEPSLNQRSKDRCEPETVSIAASRGRCCASCALM